MLQSDVITEDMLQPLAEVERALVEYLAERREHGQQRVPSTQIEQDLQIPANKQNNAVRDLVRGLNFKHIPIISTNHGFKFPVWWHEVVDYRDSLISRANEIYSRAHAVDDCLPPGLHLVA